MEICVGDAANVEFPVGFLVSQMALFLLLPIGLGMGARAWLGDATRRYVPWINRIAVVTIIALTFSSASGNQTSLPAGGELALAQFEASLWTVILLQLDADSRFTFLLEFSARNVALAFIVAVSSLGRLDLGFFSGVYAMTGFPAAIAIAVIRGRWRRLR
jgi:predicted Na+-dependent transporter